MLLPFFFAFSSLFYFLLPLHLPHITLLICSFSTLQSIGHLCPRDCTTFNYRKHCSHFNISCCSIICKHNCFCCLFCVGFCYFSLYYTRVFTCLLSFYYIFLYIFYVPLCQVTYLFYFLSLISLMELLFR